MGNSENRGKSAATKSSAAAIRASAIRTCEICGTDSGGTTLAEFAEGAIGGVSRSRKAGGRGEVADQIGLGLRTVYDDVLSQPVPDRFFDLLRQLERVGGSQAKKDAP